MASARLYLARGHLYAMAADAEVLRLPLAASTDDADPATLAEAAGWLRSKPGAAGRVELLLASSRVRFATVPWVMGTFTAAAIRRQAERELALAGCALADWQLRIQWPEYGAPSFVVAYPRGLLSAIDDALHAAGLVVERSMATAVAVARRYARTMPSGPGLLCFGEDDGPTGVYLESGAITEVEHLPHDGGGLDAVDVWCRRKWFEHPGEGRLRWLQAAHCPEVFAGRVLTAEGSGSGCISTDLLEATA